MKRVEQADRQITTRRDEVLRRMLNTPPKPRTKTQKESSRKPAKPNK